MKKAFVISISFVVVALILVGSFWFNKKDPPPQPPPPLVPTDLSIYDPTLVEVILQCAQKMRDFPNDDKLRLQLGMVYEANAIYPLANQTYHQHLNRNPEDASVWYRMAIVYERIGLLGKSIESIKHSAGIYNKYAPIQWRLGAWLFDSGQIDAAHDAFGEYCKSQGSILAYYHRHQAAMERSLDYKGHDLSSRRNSETSYGCCRTMARRTIGSASPSGSAERPPSSRHPLMMRTVLTPARHTSLMFLRALGILTILEPSAQAICLTF